MSAFRGEAGAEWTQNSTPHRSLRPGQMDAGGPSAEAFDTLLDLAGQHDYRLAVDLAAGAGATAFALTAVAQRVVAVATSPAALAVLALTARRRGLSSLAAVRAAGGRLPLADGCADLITCRAAPGSLHRVRRALDEIVRILAPDGVFLLTGTAHSDDEWLEVTGADDNSTPGHSPLSWRRLLEEHGLTADTTLITRARVSGDLAPPLGPFAHVRVERGPGPSLDEALARASWSNAVIRARRGPAAAPPRR